MERAIILADSSCDISNELEQKIGNIRVINLNVAIDGECYKDRADIRAADVYSYFDQTGNIPLTSQITMLEFAERFYQLAEEGYQHILCSCINGKGSNTYDAAKQGMELFYQEHPEHQKVKIYPLDSHTYSLGHGFPLLKASEQLKQGIDPAKVAEETQKLFDELITVVGLFSLSYAKRSGRLNAVSAFVGEVLGLKPMMTICGENKVVEKVRGEQALMTAMAKYYINHAIDSKGEYVIAYGDNIEWAYTLEKNLVEMGAKKAVGIYPIGTCIACNSGPKMLGLAFAKKA